MAVGVYPSGKGGHGSLVLSWQVPMVGLQGCPSISASGSHHLLSSLQKDNPALHFMQVSVLSRGCCLRVPSTFRLLALPCLPHPVATAGTIPSVTCLFLACRGCAGCALWGALCHHSTGLPAVHLQAPQPECTVSDGELQEEGAEG